MLPAARSRGPALRATRLVERSRSASWYKATVATAVDVAKTAARRLLGHTNWYLHRSIRGEGGRIPAEPPRKSWINSTLKSGGQVDEAVAEAQRCGLVPHCDRPKNWDSLSALAFILGRKPTTARVLDVGAADYSVMLPWLYQYGYRDLIGIDLVHTAPFRYGPIRYENGDLTRTRFERESFDVVCSMSVIEHGVPIDAYFAETRRILRPGGLLITSTDYWHEPIDTKGQQAHGAPVRIFTAGDISKIVVTGRDHGFRMTAPALDTACSEPAVTWARHGLQYTFICFAMERV